MCEVLDASRGKRDRKPSPIAEAAEEAKQALQAPKKARMQAPKKARKQAAEVLYIGDLSIFDEVEFAAKHKRKLEVANRAGRPLESREACEQQEARDVAAWEAKRGVACDKLKRSQLPLAARGPRCNAWPSAPTYDSWRVVQPYRQAGVEGAMFYAFNMSGPSFFTERRAAIEVVEMVGFVNFCIELEKAYALNDVMSEKMAERLAAAEGLSLARNEAIGHLTGFVDVTLASGVGKFKALHQVHRDHTKRTVITIGTYTGRFEAALERARFMRRKGQ